MDKRKDYSSTELNRRDRKILDKYTKTYTNFYETYSDKYNSLDEQSIHVSDDAQ